MPREASTPMSRRRCPSCWSSWNWRAAWLTHRCDGMSAQDRQAEEASRTASMSWPILANQGTMYQDVVDLFDDALATEFADFEHDTHSTVDKGHGRLDHRQYWTISDPECHAYLNAKQTWTGLRSIGMGDRQTQSGRAGVQRAPLLSHEPAGGCASHRPHRAQPLEC